MVAKVRKVLKSITYFGPQSGPVPNPLCFEEIEEDLTFDQLEEVSKLLGTRDINISNYHGYYGTHNDVVTIKWP
jgi:hypothetical protein